jgi:plastocyanin
MRTRPALALALIMGIASCSSGGPEARRTPDSALGRETILGVTVVVHGRVPVRGPSASVEAMDRFFAPTILSAAPGTRVKLVLRNGGFVAHNFTLPEQKIDRDVPPGDIRTADVVVPESGRLPFWCSYHRDSDAMIGALEAG